MAGKLLALHAQTPLHPGSGTALGTVDLPIQRERHTRWPLIAGSALKGVLRDACREQVATQADLMQRQQYDGKSIGDVAREAEANDRKISNRELADATLDLNLLFGPPKAGASEFAGVLSITDARTIAFPVRSARGVFAWVSCPAALERLQRDAELAGFAPSWQVPAVSGQTCFCRTDSPCLDGAGVALLEEFEYRRADDPHINEIGDWLASHLLRDEFVGARRRFPAHFLVIGDDDFTHFVRHATEVTARIALDYETKTVRTGALFYQEFLPAETLLYAVVLASTPRSTRQARPLPDPLATLAEFLQRPVLQIGGDESTGKGICAIRFASASASRS